MANESPNQQPQDQQPSPQKKPRAAKKQTRTSTSPLTARSRRSILASTMQATYERALPVVVEDALHRGVDANSVSAIMQQLLNKVATESAATISAAIEGVEGVD